MSNFIGRVVAVHGQEYLIQSDEGAIRLPAAGRLNLSPVVGDVVAVQSGMIAEVHPRRSALKRIAPGGQQQLQVLAANLDILFVVCGLDADFNLRRLERYLILALDSGARPAFVLTKEDLCEDLDRRVVSARVIAGEYPLILSGLNNDSGVDEIRSLLAEGKTGALIGSSGAGKSTLINRLLGEEKQLTQEVRTNDGKGRHTTTSRQMFPLPTGGWLIDQPGLRAIEIAASPESVEDAFAEIGRLAEQCRYRDCRHEAEPGCAVRGVVSAERLSSFGKLKREAARFDENVLEAVRRKSKIKVIHRAMRGHYRH